MANNQYVNKVKYGDSTLIDLTSDTVTASTLLSGYTAHDASGAPITGTATAGGGGSVTQDQDGYIVLPDTGGGGGGLVYETGTWTPSTDVEPTTISFENTHTTRPFFVAISDTSNSTIPNGAVVYWTIYSIYDATGIAPTVNGTTYQYARTQHGRKASDTFAAGGSNVTSLTTLANSLTNSQFVPSFSTGVYFISGRTYKWIAVWAPTN